MRLAVDLRRALDDRGTTLTLRGVDGTWTATAICPLAPGALQAVAAEPTTAIETALRMVDAHIRRWDAARERDLGEWRWS